MTYEQYLQILTSKRNLEIEKTQLWSKSNLAEFGLAEMTPAEIARKKAVRAELKKIEDALFSKECFDIKTATAAQAKEILAITSKPKFAL